MMFAYPLRTSLASQAEAKVAMEVLNNGRIGLAAGAIGNNKTSSRWPSSDALTERRSTRNR